MISIFRSSKNFKLLLNNNNNFLLKSCLHQTSQLLNIKKAPLNGNKLHEIKDIDHHIKKMSKAKILNITNMNNNESKWIALDKIEYQDPSGKNRIWEMCHRTSRKGDCDAVCIYTILSATKDKPRETLLVSQFRPPVGKLTFEFPAGLIDENETAEQAAVRELKEETGYHGVVREISPIIFSDPGLTNANMKLVVMDVDRSLKINQNVVAVPDEGEFIDVFHIPIDDLYSFLIEKEKTTHAVDSRLLHFAYGLCVASKI
jgi:ADP-ribose pyrophosphatase